MFNTLVSISSWGKVIKFALFLIPVGLAWWNSSSADRYKNKFNEQSVKLEQTETSLELAEFANKQYKEKAELLEDSTTRLQQQKDKAIFDRNKAWAAMGRYKDEKQAYLRSNNLTDMEKRYADCQPIPVPASRKPVR